MHMNNSKHAILGTIARPDTKRMDSDPSEIDNLQDAVCYACSSASSGAQVTKTNGGTIKVYDCPIWKSEYTAILNLIRPRATASFTSSSNSLSGFQINIQEPPTDNALLRIAMVCCITLCCMGVAMWTLVLYCRNSEHTEL